MLSNLVSISILIPMTGPAASELQDDFNVHSDDKWPPTDPLRINKVSGEPYYTPDFARDVNHPTNTAIFQKVARLTMGGLKVSPQPTCEYVNMA